MSDPDNVRAGFRTLLNQLPETMPLSYAVIDELGVNLESVRGDSGSVDPELIQKFANRIAGLLLASVVQLENRIEKLEGRQGVPDGFIGAVLSEFRAD
ncbi:MAG: hypothetical protein CL534_16165 [Ahrensia sp.]|nr:hypothetical protein [Ahrensia sp.]